MCNPAHPQIHIGRWVGSPALYQAVTVSGAGCVVRLAALDVGTGLLLPALAQCAEDQRAPSCNHHTNALEQELPLCKGAELCATGCHLLLCPQAVEEWFGELVGNLLTPTPIGVEGSWQVPDAMSSAQVTVLYFWMPGAVHRSPYRVSY